MEQKKYTVTQFENALTTIGVEIDEIKYRKNDRNVLQVIGYKFGQKYKWNSQGKCFCQSIAYPTLDLNLES